MNNKGNKIEYKVLVNYRVAAKSARDIYHGTTPTEQVAVTQALYTGPHRKHADKAMETAYALARHGILQDCEIKFFDGYKLRDDYTIVANDVRGK